MKSSELLLFIKERFVNVYKEHPNTDYLIAIKNLADEINDKDFKISFLQGQNNELSAENQFLNDEYQQFIEMLPKDARYLDPPDGGSVHPSEQMRRMIADLNEQIEKLKLNSEAFAIRLEDSENQYSELHDKNSSLAAQNAELAAQVERFATVIAERFTCKERQPDDTVITDGAPWALELLRTTPVQHLRDVKAEAGKEGYLIGVKEWRQADDNHMNFNIDAGSDQYAARVRVDKNA